MQTVHYAAMISAVPIQDLLLMAIVFTVAALILLVVSIDAGNYPKISAAVRRIHCALHHRPPRHWPGNDYAEERRLNGH
jgi:hypothetical protein